MGRIGLRPMTFPQQQVNIYQSGVGAPPSCRNLNVTSVTDSEPGRMQKINQESHSARLTRRNAGDQWERQMSYLLNVANGRPMLRTAASVILAFCCAAPFVLLFSSLVVYGVRSFIH